MSVNLIKRHQSSDNDDLTDPDITDPEITRQNHAGNTRGYQCRVAGSAGSGKTRGYPQKKTRYPSLGKSGDFRSITALCI